MLYIDTCVLLAVLMPEVHSAAATALFAEASVPLAISSWSQAQAEAVLQGFERSLAPGLLMLELEPQDFRNANACLRGWTTTLRAADALHLAIASGRGATLCSLDAPFVAAAQQLGLNAQLLEAGVPPSRSSPL